MTDADFLERMLFEFSSWHAMHDEPFKPRAYQLASESVAVHGADLRDTWKKGGVKALKTLPGIGASIAEKIDEYFRTGKVQEYAAMKKRFPVDMWGLSRVEGIGPKHVLDLWQALRIKDQKTLAAAIKAKKIRALPGFGVKSEQKLAKGLQLQASASKRVLLGNLLPTADRIVETLAAVHGVERCVYAGSLRRKQETIGDIDLIATTRNPAAVMEAFVSLPIVASVLSRGKTRTSVRLKQGIDADLRVVPDQVFGATLQYFTGDRRHNVLLREHAIRKGYKLNEYGLFKGKKLIVCKTEEEIYQKLGMATPPPELRVGADELLAAQQHRLPNLLPYRSIKGDLQIQTDWTDGSDSIEAMAQAAKREGLSYIAITDHTQALAFVSGLDERGVAKQGKAIDALNKKRDPRLARLLKGTEMDIRMDGTLDLSDKALATLDWVGVSIHSGFHMEGKAMTARIVKALAHPLVDCLFHPTGRLIGKREPYDLDMAEVIATAKKYRVALEIDAYPERSDLKDLHVRMAVEAGVPLVINSDAHAVSHLTFLRLGEAIARRGWAEKRHIINTKSLTDFRRWLEKKRPRKGWTA